MTFTARGRASASPEAMCVVCRLVLAGAADARRLRARNWRIRKLTVPGRLQLEFRDNHPGTRSHEVNRCGRWLTLGGHGVTSAGALPS